jgi:hypothetical protein
MTKVHALPVHTLPVLRVATLVFALLMLWALMPAGHARAAGMTEAQIQAVLNLLSTFGTDANTVANVNIALRGGGPGDMKNLRPLASSTPQQRPEQAQGDRGAQPPACVVFARTLVKGSQGDDVKSLQDFLIGTGDLKEATSTTYFGQKTEDALTLWQLREGVASTTGDMSGLGSFGPLTRGRIVERCMKIMQDERANASTTRPALPPKPRPAPTSTTMGASVSVVPVSLTKTVSLLSDGVAVLADDVNHNFSLMGTGAAAVFDAYISLFEIQ